MVGYIGEFHPEVLEAWQIDMPTSGFEFEITTPQA
jgi:phenylalanyl-tRNA synthetase beta subunit